MKKIIRWQKITWINIFKPTKEDLDFLKENYKIHPLILEEFLTAARRPKVETHPSYLFMILNYPFYDKETRETTSRELDIIATKNTLITSCRQPILPLQILFENCEKSQKSRQYYFQEGVGVLLFNVLSGFWKSSFIKLERIEKRIEDIQKSIFQGHEKEMVREISLVKTDIINFWRIIEPQQEILESLYKEGLNFFGSRLVPYFSDLLGTYDQIIHELSSFKEIILALEETNQSLLSNKTNETIKVLTIFSVILLPLTLLSSIWGMNFSYLPLAQNPIGFWITMALMVAITISMVILFKKKGWL